MRTTPLLLALMGLICTAGSLFAAEPEEFDGRWEFVDGEAERQAAIEAMVLEFPGMLRGVARRRLNAAVPIRSFWDIRWDGQQVTFTSPYASGWSTDLERTPTPQTKDDGEEVQVTRWMEGGAIQSIASSGRGGTRSSFAIEGDRMEMWISITNPQLPRPLEYTLVYRRASE